MAEKDRVRTKKLQVFVTEDELEVAKKKAELASMNVSTYVRKMIVDGFVIAHDNKEEIARLTEEINAIGNNINQIARKVNTVGEAERSDMDNLMSEFVDLQAVVAEYAYRV